MTWLSAIEYLCEYHGYVPLVVNTSRSFPRSWLISGFVARLTRRASLVEQELLTIPEHLSSSTVFSGVRVTRYSVVCVCFVDRCLSFCTFFFGHYVVCSSSIYGFWLPPLVSLNSFSTKTRKQNGVNMKMNAMKYLTLDNNN